MQIYERKYFEYSAKKELFWMKLFFKTKEQERDFMISCEGMPENPLKVCQHTQLHDV